MHRNVFAMCVSPLVKVMMRCIMTKHHSAGVLLNLWRAGIREHRMGPQGHQRRKWWIGSGEAAGWVCVAVSIHAERSQLLWSRRTRVGQKPITSHVHEATKNSQYKAIAAHCNCLDQPVNMTAAWGLLSPVRKRTSHRLCAAHKLELKWNFRAAGNTETSACCRGRCAAECEGVI